MYTRLIFNSTFKTLLFNLFVKQLKFNPNASMNVLILPIVCFMYPFAHKFSNPCSCFRQLRWIAFLIRVHICAVRRSFVRKFSNEIIILAKLHNTLYNHTLYDDLNLTLTLNHYCWSVLIQISRSSHCMPWIY